MGHLFSAFADFLLLTLTLKFVARHWPLKEEHFPGLLNYLLVCLCLYCYVVFSLDIFCNSYFQGVGSY